MKLLPLLFTLTLTACGASGQSPDVPPANTPPQSTGNEQLTNLHNQVVSWTNTPDTIQIGYGELPEGIAGTFYGRKPNHTSNIIIDVSMKKEHWYSTVWAVAHEECHYRQWIAGVVFDQGNLPHDDRWYEQECNQAGTDFLNWYVKAAGDV